MKLHASKRPRKRGHSLNKTCRGAFHNHNPAGTKLTRKFYKALKQTEERLPIMEATLAGYYSEMTRGYNKFMWANHPSYMDRKNKGLQQIHGE